MAQGTNQYVMVQDSKWFQRGTVAKGTPLTLARLLWSAAAWRQRSPYRTEEVSEVN